VSFVATLKNELAFKTLAQSIVGGGVIGFFEVVYAISMAGLLFSGDLQPYLTDGIGIALITAAVTLVLTSLLTSTPVVIGNVQVSFIVIINVAITAIVTSSAVPPESLLPTVLVTISLSTLMQGALFFALGYYRLTDLVRQIPYPVIAGFLGGLGWLVILGAVETMSGIPVEVDTLLDLIQPETLILWLPGLIIGLVLFVVSRRVQHFLAIPLTLVGCFAAFYGGMLLMGVSVDQGLQNGLLLSEIARDIRWQPITLDVLSATDWGAILQQTGTIVTSIITTLVTLVLYLSGIDVDLRQNVDLNAEFKSTGVTNLFSGALGGSVGIPSMSMTTLNLRLNSDGRLTGIVAGGLALLALIAGSGVLIYVPIAIMGGMLTFIGYGFVYNWLIAGIRKFSRVDYAIVWLIALALVFVGFIEGVIIGLLMTILVFVVRYSRIGIFYRISAGTEVESHVERHLHQTKELKNLLRRVQVMELQGFIFFGTATRLLDAIHARLDDTTQPDLQYLILDFQRVRGIDASADLIFSKTMLLAENQNFQVIITGLADTMRQQIQVLNTETYQEWLQPEPDLERGIAWCEEQLLMNALVTLKHVPLVLQDQLEDMGLDPHMAGRLGSYLEEHHLDENEYLFRQGDSASDFYFVQIGQVSVYLETNDGRRLRLRTMTAGTIVGEMGFYLDRQRSASVITDVESIVQRFSKDALSRMKQQDPYLASAFHELIVRVVANRLVDANTALAART